MSERVLSSYMVTSMLVESSRSTVSITNRIELKQIRVLFPFLPIVIKTCSRSCSTSLRYASLLPVHARAVAEEGK